MPLSPFLAHDRAANAGGQDKDDNPATIGPARKRRDFTFSPISSPLSAKGGDQYLAYCLDRLEKWFFRISSAPQPPGRALFEQREFVAMDGPAEHARAARLVLRARLSFSRAAHRGERSCNFADDPRYQPRAPLEAARAGALPINDDLYIPASARAPSAMLPFCGKRRGARPTDKRRRRP
ncbi:hypothetical protein C5689_14870 [Methylosinus sporium]|uniref:Uncharacterized protein n=1 Tax=Methylosinus sporium TaxID=428 RepID=A0A2U1SN67_METSR|nr:hypothetical protein C5689_14870 [Methylosinus sporium]